MTTPLASHPLSSRSSSLGARLLAGVGTLTLLAAIGLFASRPARTAGGPIPVTVANTPLAVVTTGGTPVEGYVTVSDPSATSFSNLVYTVPAGKYLVVEGITLLPTLIGTTAGYTGVILHEDAVGNILSLSTLSAGPGVGAVSGTTQPIRIHAGPGDKILANVFKTGAGGISAYVSLSGFLVDAP